jgi:hypothetical protein
MFKRITDAVASAAVSVVVVLALTALPLWASQNNLYNPTTGTLSGLTMVQGFNNAIDSVNTCNSGASAPGNQLSGAPSAGNCWYNTATGAVQFYDGTNWLTAGYIDATNHVFTPVVGGGASASVASASTTNLCGASGTAPTQSFLSITGSATITSFGSNCVPGQIKILSFASALQLTYNSASMILPTTANITAASGDVAVAIYLGAGNWQVAIYQRATGSALSSLGLSIGASAIASSALGSFEAPVNLQLNATVASNQLTVAVKGVNGADPSATNPVLVGFRDASSTGTVVAGALQSALSFTLAPTSSMGCTTAVTCRLWVTLICQTISSGTCTSILVGLSVQSTPSATSSNTPSSQTATNLPACFPLNEAALQLTGAGTNGGTQIDTIQTSVASLSSKPIRIVGYIEAIWTSGTGWASIPSNIQLLGSAVKKPCDVVQGPLYNLVTSATAGSGGTTPTPASLTIGITPTSALNLIRVNADGNVQQGAGSSDYPFDRIYRATGTIAACTTPIGNVSASMVGGSGSGASTHNLAIDFPNSTSQLTYTICVWEAGGGNATFCQNFGGGSACVIEVEEIMGKLESKPAYDGAESIG